ncbi:MAG: hypothetical protein JNL02_12300 [Saprospiraceae bacterium]|nr:hypothetical protein [Saprospiraceae bacterium]
MSDRREANLLLLFITVLVLLNYPLLSLVDRQDRWLGFPALYFYLFFVWLGLIVAVALVVRKRKK